MPKPLKNCAVEKTESSDVPSVSIQEISSGLLEQMGALMVHCAGQLPALARVYQPAMASFDLQGVAQLIASGLVHLPDGDSAGLNARQDMQCLGYQGFSIC